MTFVVVAAGCAAGDGPTDLDGSLDATPGDAGPDRADTGPGDAGTDANVPTEMVGLCEECVVDAQCGLTARCAPLSDGQPVCLRLCEPEFNDCPRGFSCAGYAPLDFENVCLPVGEVCCIDEDADGYGGGASCLGPDCDDDDVARHPDAAELCDNADQDCDDTIDEAFVDCGVARCETGPSGTYQETGASGCEAGACVDPEPSSCGDYSCVDGAEEGDVCGSICNGGGADDDLFCAAVSHCDDGGCLPDLPDGGVCDEDSDCVSGNCENGFCCGAGLTCCNADMDCPGYPGVGTVCDTPSDCQGSRGTVMCNTTTFACETVSGVDDDSACGTDIVADACGFFTDLMCDGTADQPRPRCASSCSVDTECDADAHCDLAFCFPDLPDGEVCDEDSDCINSHCQNGFCCASGDCCRSASDCPGTYGSPAVCVDDRACQGTRDAAVCASSICGTAVAVPDDSACTMATIADECGLYPQIRCTGAIDQTAPACAAMCAGDSECDENAHCDAGACTPDLPNGDACDEASDCTSNYCGNGFCCGGGDCCALDSHCPAATYGRPSECLASGTCQGSRRDPVCNTTSNTCQVGDPIDDDSGCAGLESNDCGLFPAVSCTSMQDQTADQRSRCDTSCATAAECDFGAFCNSSMTCQSEGMMGDACTDASQCAGTLGCVDGVCCTGTCTGPCEACNVAGSLGTCSPVPAGTDPANECGGIDCSGYFVGFSGDVCRERADAPASAVDCDGARACESAAAVCPSQPSGAVRATCDDTCQDPVSGTCMGTTPPVCSNVDAGNISCGTGACARTVPRCVSGADNTCTPGPSGAEVCNDIDDDCDGSVDNNITGTSVNAWEPNDICGEVSALPAVTTDGATSSRTNTETAQVYYTGDVDYYSVRVNESGGSDCLTTCFDNEVSTLTVTLSVPAGAGSFQICGVKNTCGGLPGSNCITVNGGMSGTITMRGDSACCSGIFCSTNNSATFYLRVRGLAAQAWECQSYTLEYSGDEAC